MCAPDEEVDREKSTEETVGSFEIVFDTATRRYIFTARFLTGSPTYLTAVPPPRITARQATARRRVFLGWNMAKFAATTTVSVESSQTECVKILARYGATGYMTGQLPPPKSVSFIAFEYKGQAIRLEIPLAFRDSRGKAQTPDWCAQELRRRWRVLVLWLKGQLEAIDNDLLSPMQAFMPHLQLRDGRTVAQAAEAEPAFIAQIGGELMRPALEHKNA